MSSMEYMSSASCVSAAELSCNESLQGASSHMEFPISNGNLIKTKFVLATTRQHYMRCMSMS